MYNFLGDVIQVVSIYLQILWQQVGDPMPPATIRCVWPMEGEDIDLNNEKRAPGCFGYIGDYATQFIGIIINH